MFRRILALMMIVMMLPAALALAETTPLYQVSTFAGRLPERLQEPLSALISDETRIISGAAIQHSGKLYEADEIGSWESYSAMVIVDTDEGPLLLAAAWVDGLAWQVDDFTRFLRREENVSVSIYQPGPNRIPVFSVDYPGQIGLVSDLMIFRGNRLWQLTGHIDEAAGVQISVDINNATINDNDGKGMYECAEPFWMDYLADITEFPTTRADVETFGKMATSIFVSNDAAGLGYTEGANLRREPTSNSESLGLYNKEVPLTLTGKQQQGTSHPWYEVRIGNTLGWMSANYVRYYLRQYYPVPMGRTLDSCPLYAMPGDSQPLQQLEPGTTFHILTEYKGMYHICIPQGEISWEVDRDGVYGYIPTSDLLTAYSPSMLDALEDAQ